MDRIRSAVVPIANRVRSLRPAAILALLVALLVVAGAGTLAISTIGTGDSEMAYMPQELVEPRPESHAIWPYTSRDRTASERTLAINVVVYGDADTVRYYLTGRVDATWNETTEEWQDVDPDEGDGIEVVDRNGTVLGWAAARGATRYMYVHNAPIAEAQTDPGDRRSHRALRHQPEVPYEWGGQWIAESYQVHDGDYFGTRYHLRVYESPYETDEWVAIQAHTEHWDWFRLRHTVDGTERAQNRVESEFMGQVYVEDVWRMHLGNDRGADSDGWATVVELGQFSELPDAEHVGPIAIALVLARSVRRTVPSRGRHTDQPRGSFRGTTIETSERGADRSDAPDRLVESTKAPISSLGTAFDRFDGQVLPLAVQLLGYTLLFVSLLALYLSVRAGGILLEQHAGTRSPKLIAASLYPVIVVGLPLCAYLFARTIDPARSFVLASAGIGLAIVADYSYLAITVLPIDVIVHRVGIVIAIGLIATGASVQGGYRPDVDRLLGAGVLLWVFLLIAPLVGWV